jgi:hypothetical protein
VPSQLLQRLNRFLDQQKAQQIMALEAVPRVDHTDPHSASPTQNLTPHWPAGQFGDVMGTIQCIVIHETSGTPSYAGNQTFVGRYTCTVNVDRGIGPQYFIEPNGTAFTLIGDQNLAGSPRMTWHGGWPSEHIDMNPYSLGIENADIGDSSISPGNGRGPHWWQLSTQSEDLTGMKVYLTLFPDQQPDANLIWIARFAQEWVELPAPPPPPPPAHPPPPQFALHAGVRPGFQGTGDIADGANPGIDRHIARPRAWRNMLFTERNFRSLVLLCRLLAEQNGIPRNFPLLPYASADQDRPNVAVFRRLILAEQRRDAIAAQLGTTTAAIQANTAAFVQFYQAHPAQTWSRLFGANPGQGPSAAHPHGVLSTPVTPCFRGILAHSVNGGHPCPGPLFDWYRFAREVWDWWWYPFDIEAAGPSTTMRPYFQARHNTPLLEYYYDAHGDAAAYDALVQRVTIEETFVLPNATPIYAMSNGVVVAACLGSLSATSATTGFLLVRHEVFHRAANNRIDYDHAPTYVWTLIKFLQNPGFNIPSAPPALPAATPAGNPSWLNRFIIRLRECELAVQFHTANAAGNAALRTAWLHNPSAPGPRGSTGQEIERDAAAYRRIADDLTAGHVARFPLEASTDTTPVRVCLGDFLGFPGPTSTGVQGIQIEIFSKEELPVPHRAQRVVSASTESWWPDVTAALRHEAAVEADLPANGMVWHYSTTDFLAWINHITWLSEWEKYGVTVDGAPAPAPARPQTRIVN